MANITDLYEALDVLDEDARTTAEDFSKTGDLAALEGRLSGIGSYSYTLADAVRAIAAALKLDSSLPGPAPHDR